MANINDDSDIFGSSQDNSNTTMASMSPSTWKDPYNYESESFPKKLLRILGTGLANTGQVGGFAGSLAEGGLSKLLGKDVNIPFLPTLESIKKGREAFSEKFLPDKEYLEPRDIPTKIASAIGGDLPFIAATGGAGLLKSLASNATMSGLESMGTGPVGQMIGGALAGGGIDYVRHGGLAGSPLKPGQSERLFGVDTLTDFAQRTKKSAYEEAHKVGTKLKLDASVLENTLDSTLNRAQKDLTRPEYKALFDEVKTLGKDINRGKIDGSSILSARQKFNRLSKEAYAKGDKELGAHYDNIAKEIRSVVNKGKSVSAQYGKHVGSGDELVQAFANQGKLRNFLEKATELKFKNPLTKIILMGSGAGVGGILGLGKGAMPAVLGTAAGGTVGYASGLLAREVARVGQLAMRSPIIRQHLKKIMINVGKDRMKQLPFDLAKLDKEVSKATGNGQPYTLEDVL